MILIQTLHLSYQIVYNDIHVVEESWMNAGDLAGLSVGEIMQTLHLFQL
jgi:hypothetical protein